MKLKPYLLLFFLIVVLFFILGVRYGQKVEKTNKAISYVLSLTPVKNPTPTPPPLQFQAYSHKNCGVQFIYPQTIVKKEEATNSAMFIDDKNSLIELNCNKEKISQLLEDKIATEEIQFQNKKIVVKIKAEDIMIFQLKNPLNGKIIDFQISRNLLPLLEASLKYISQ